MITAKHFCTYENLKKKIKIKKPKFALISEIVRDGAKRMRFGDHMYFL